MASVDVVTLDNFAERLPQWHADDTNHLHALVDMGSNGIRFSISDLSPPTTRLLPCVYRERAAISLFDALQPAGPDGALAVLPAATIAQVAATLARFRRIAVDGYGVAPARMAVLATEAMRRAANAADLLEALAAAAPGLAVFVLAPAVETLFGAMGARAAWAVCAQEALAPRGALMLDLGGGSVQITYVDPSQGAGYEVAAARAGQSLPYGAARLTRLAAPASSESSPLSATAAAATAAAAPQLVDDLVAALARLRDACPGLQAALAVGVRAPPPSSLPPLPPLDLYLCGGGFRGYGSVLMGTEDRFAYPIPLIHGYTVPGSVFADTAAVRARLANKGDDHQKIPGVSKRRRAQFPAITAVVDALVAALARTGFAVYGDDGDGGDDDRTQGPRIGSVTFCAGGNREGALLMRLPPALREADPLAVLAASEAAAAGGGGVSAEVLHAATAALQSALPPTTTSAAAHPPPFPAELLPLVAARIWAQTGADGAANASRVLHEAVTRGPSTPGLTHRARALLAMSGWARWGGGGGGVQPADDVLLRGLWCLLEEPVVGDEGGRCPWPAFWAEYVGCVAALLALVFPAPPRSASEMARVRFRPALTTTTTTTTTHGKPKTKQVVRLAVDVPAALAAGLAWPAAATDCFAVLDKAHVFAPEKKPYKKHIKLDVVVAEALPG